VLSALFTALALVLPFLTGQLPQLGNMLCPMHIPVLLCGFICGPIYGTAVGALCPILRFLLFSMPPIYPTGVAMAFELAAYGLFSGFLHRIFPRKYAFIYPALILSMLAGRAVWGVTYTLIAGMGALDFGFAAFITAAFVNAFPGIILQIVAIPPCVALIERYLKLQ